MFFKKTAALPQGLPDFCACDAAIRRSDVYGPTDAFSLRKRECAADINSAIGEVQRYIVNRK